MSKVRERLDPLSTQGPETVDDLVVVLGGSETLEMLGISSDDLELARTDPFLLETLRITHRFLETLRESDVLGAFLRVPRPDRTSFLRWIASTDDRDARDARTQTLIAALRESPLGEDVAD